MKKVFHWRPKLSLSFPSWLKAGTESVIWNVVGNLIPIWFVVVITIYENGWSKMQLYDAIHQPYTFLILSASYLTTTFYILTRKENLEKSRSTLLIFLVLLMFIGYSVKDRKALEDASASFNKELFVVITFCISFLIYVYHEYRSHWKLEKSSASGESRKQFDQLRENFKSSDEDEDN